MKLKFVYGILPALVVYTDRIKNGFAGCANAMVVRIRPAFKDNEGLLQHERVHVRQAYRLLFLIHALLYLLIAPYRLRAEVEAYRKQLEYSADRDAAVAVFAFFICDKYRLDMDQFAAETMLKGKD